MIPQILKDFLKELDLDDFNEVYSYAQTDELHSDMIDIANEKDLWYVENQDKYAYRDED